jgi:hypothetical protein
LERCRRLRTRLRLRLRARLRFNPCLDLNLNLNRTLCLVGAGREDRMDAFPFIHKPEAIRLDFLTLPVKGQEPEKAFQLHPDHLGQRVPLAADLPDIDWITENIVVIVFHYVYSILFEKGIQQGPFPFEMKQSVYGSEKLGMSDRTAYQRCLLSRPENIV